VKVGIRVLVGKTGFEVVQEASPIKPSSTTLNTAIELILIGENLLPIINNG
jgi:hypothetical protein